MYTQVIKSRYTAADSPSVRTRRVRTQRAENPAQSSLEKSWTQRELVFRPVLAVRVLLLQYRKAGDWANADVDAKDVWRQRLPKDTWILQLAYTGVDLGRTELYEVH